MGDRQLTVSIPPTLMGKVLDMPSRNVFVTIVIRRLLLGRGFEVRLALLGDSRNVATALRPLLSDVARDLERLGIATGIVDHAVRHLLVGDECVLESMVVEVSRLETFRTSSR